MLYWRRQASCSLTVSSDRAQCAFVSALHTLRICFFGCRCIGVSSCARAGFQAEAAMHMENPSNASQRDI
jgi:hypothetical protein